MIISNLSLFTRSLTVVAAALLGYLLTRRFKPARASSRRQALRVWQLK